MTRFRFVVRSFSHYIRRNLLVSLGIALATAVLTGALMIGDSMRYSLERITLSRLGNISHIITVSDRYFRASLAGDLERETGLPVAPLLQLDGMAVAEGGERRVNQIQVLGVDGRFDGVTGGEVARQLEGDDVIVSENLALQLGVKPGDAILVRIAKATLMPRNTPFVSENETTVTLRATIRAVAGRDRMGLFNLRNSQRAPYNLFVSLERLNRLMEFENRANRLLIAGDARTDFIAKALDKSLTPEDAGLVYRKIGATDEAEISTERIFLEEKVSETFSLLPGSRPLMTYFVNAIAKDGRTVPYSFATSWPGANLAGKEILVNDWTAEDLGVAPGDSVTVSWFEIGPLRQLNETTRKLVVKGIVPLEGAYADSTLMPRIPGISDAGHCREWEAGVPIDLSRIRKKDEDYWNHYKGTPKIFVSPELAQEAWANRFGSHTAVRFLAGELTEVKFREMFTSAFTFSDFGFSLVAAREEGLQAARGGVDFGQLFLGLSFFLLLSAILLSALLFRLNLENRGSQTGTLLQLGFTKKATGGLLMAEAALIAIPGVLAGLLLAYGYVRVVFTFLNTLWWEIVRTPVIFVKVVPGTLLAGALASLIIALVSVMVPVRKFLNRQVADLYRIQDHSGKNLRGKAKRVVTAGLIVMALFLIIWQLATGGTGDPLLFFLSGGMLLAGLLMLFSLLIPALETAGRNGMTRKGMALRLISRNRGRSLSVVLLFAVGTFMVIAIGANRQGMLSNSADRTSGTGGFSHFAETAVPVLYDLNDRERRLQEGLDSSFRVIQFHRVAGDDASCLNLNRIENPAILGFDAGSLEGRFSFVATTGDLDPENPWLSLKKSLPGDVIPAIADQTVIQWGLMMKVGDTLLYQAENGDTLRIRLIGGLAPSIFQGYILIDNAHFIKHFPSHSGSSVFLIDSPVTNGEEAAGELGNLLRDNGIEITPAPLRLAEFSSVTNTYLAIFLALGLLGLLIGTIGLSIVLARSILERRREFAVLLAIGYTGKMVVSQVLTEYLFMLFSGVMIGFISAVAAILPVIIRSFTPVPAGWISLFVLLIMGNGWLWISLLANHLVKPRKLLPALRDL